MQIADIAHSRIHQATNQTTDESTLVGTFDTIGQGYGSPNDIIVYKPGKAFLTTNPGDLISLDLSEPSFPLLMNASKPNGISVQRIAVATDYSYIGTGGAAESMDLAVTSSREGKVSTINVTDPYTPGYIKAVTDQTGADLIRIVRDIAINKNSGLAFAVTIDAVLVIDIKDPYKPKLLNEIKLIPGTTTPIGSNMSLTQRDGWVYLASDNNGIRTMDFYTPPLNGVDSSVAIDSVNDVTIDADGYTLGELKVNYTINPPGYVASNAKVILVEDGIGIKTVSGPTSGTGSAVFPSWIKLDKAKKYEVYVVLNCNPPNTKVSERKKIEIVGSCKAHSGGALIDIPDGSKSSDGGSCCYKGEMQQNYPILDIEKCPKRVRITGYDSWASVNGCGGSDGAKVPDNPMYTIHQGDLSYLFRHNSNDGNFLSSCNAHDACYVSCNTPKSDCDSAFGTRMNSACFDAFGSDIRDAINLTECLGFSLTYEGFVSSPLGNKYYSDGQKEACKCCYN